MAIGKKPDRSRLLPPPTPADEEAAAAFILGADHGPAETPIPQPPAATPASTEPEKPAKITAKVNKEPVQIRFDPDTLAEIDRRAGRLGVSRAGWVRMIVARHLDRSLEDE